MPARHLSSVLALGACSALMLTACGSSEGGTGSATAVTAGDTTCEVATTQFGSGAISFKVTNAGKDTTEVYVYGKGSKGDFDKVVGEVENIAPGASRDFSVSVTPGDYEVACKPGQTGDGIRTPITVAGTAPTTTSEAAYDREVEVTAQDFSFTGLDGLSVTVGEKIEFKLVNASETLEHEFEIFRPDGTVLGEIGPTAPGKEGEIILEFTEAGTYTYVSGVGDDEAKGMRGTFIVA